MKNGFRHAVKEIPASKLVVDPRVQRDPPTKGRVANLVDSFDLNSIGVMTVSQRADGTFSLLDGQTRRQAMAALGIEDYPVYCNVYKGLSLADEARLFRKLNNTRKPRPIDDFRVGLTEGDPDLVGANDIVEAHGFKVTDGVKDAGVTCVSTLVDCYRRDPAALDGALSIIHAAWGLNGDGTRGPILKGLHRVLEVYGDEIDRPTLTKKLAAWPGGASGILGQARMLSTIRNSSLAALVASTVVTIYNRGRRSGALDDI